MWTILETEVLGAIETVTDPAGVPGCMISSGMIFCAPGNLEVAERTAAARRAWRKRLETRLRKATDWRSTSAGNAEVMSRYVVSLIEGLSVEARDGATREQLTAVGRLALATLRGVSSRKERTPPLTTID